MNTRNQEDRSVLALLYDEYRRTYPETAESIQREIETLYQQRHITMPQACYPGSIHWDGFVRIALYIQITSIYFYNPNMTNSAF